MIVSTKLEWLLIFSTGVLIHVGFLSAFQLKDMGMHSKAAREIKVSFLTIESPPSVSEVHFESEQSWLDGLLHKDPSFDMDEVSANQKNDHWNALHQKISDIKIAKKEAPKDDPQDRAQAHIKSMRKILSVYYPVYPAWAKNLGLESEVTVKFSVDSKGNIKEVLFKTMSGYPELDVLALAAVRKWKFHPVTGPMRHGEEWAEAVFRFHLK